MWKRNLKALLSLLLAIASCAASARDDAVDRYIRGEMIERRIPGLSLAVVQDGEIVKARGYGYANLERQTPATEHTVYDLGSIGKQFTATAIMILVERGQISLDEKISHYLPDLPVAWADVSVRNLLNHTAGIPDYFSAPGLSWTENYTHDELIALAANRPPHFAPGEQWRYVNTNYVLLQRIIEAVTGQSWDAFLERVVFEPLAMTSTRRVTPEVIADAATPYEEIHGTQDLRTLEHTSSSLFVNGSGGLLSNVLDLAKWDAALYGERVLTQASLAQMWTRTPLSDGSVRDYGFGFDVEQLNGHRRIGHSGGLPGYETHIARFVDDKLTVIILTNRLGSRPYEMASAVAGMYNSELASR